MALFLVSYFLLRKRAEGNYDYIVTETSLRDIVLTYYDRIVQPAITYFI